MAAYSGLAEQAKQLDRIQEQLQEATTKDSPTLILIQPLSEKVNEIHHAVYEMLNEAARSNTSPSRAIKEIEEEISGLLTQLADELAQEPWHNPQVLRRTRKTLEAITGQVEDLQEQRKRAEKAAAKANGASRPVAPSGVNAGPKRKNASAQPLTIEDALGMLLDKRGTKWQGGLVGIVHAAGVQEMTPLSAHSPGRFEFIFAPKSQAAWNLHTYATMV
mmetsp:Transcript_34007/g.68626  ORF Transcript_34007/g.68626 Transcript_34007/m.68626 type:complete len:219 (-) Transcript_34007:180-836(-)